MGLTIAAYLYEPVLKPGEKAPGILLIHGGPTASFNDTYQAEAQYFAMRGYAVLLPNIRGSSGYGRQFEDANNGCWGRCDLKDVVAGVDFLKRQPYILAVADGHHRHELRRLHDTRCGRVRTWRVSGGDRRVGLR